MFSFPGFRNHRQSALEAEMEKLRRQASRLAAKASRFGVDAYRDTSRDLPDIYGGVSDFLSDALPLGRRNARGVDRLAHDHPGATAALAGLVALGLLAAILYTRR